jgi:uncharacterized membrane protein YphA (DoxX/SURF4 family)
MNAMNVILWVLQVLLAALFIWHGSLFLAPPPELVEIMEREFALWFRLFLGTAEVLAGIGLTLPGIIRVQPRMISVTAACCMFVMVSATVHHSMRGETSSAVTTSILLLILGFVAYMRWKVLRIRPREQNVRKPATTRPERSE